MRHIIIGLLVAFITIGCAEYPIDGSCCEEHTALAYANGHDCDRINEATSEWEYYDLPAMEPIRVTGVSRFSAIEKGWRRADKLVQQMATETGLWCHGGYSYGVLYNGVDVDGSPKHYHPQPDYELLD